MTAIERNDVRVCIEELGFEGAFRAIDFSWVRDEEFHALREVVRQCPPDELHDAKLNLASYIGVDLEAYPG